jgi:hypothetical protein
MKNKAMRKCKGSEGKHLLLVRNMSFVVSVHNILAAVLILPN